MSSLTKVLALLDAIFRRADERSNLNLPTDAPATTKAVQNLIERQLGAGDTLLLFTASDVKLEARLLAKLQNERSTVHAHVHDDIAARMEREGARVGDVTVTLAWDDFNDLDLHVVCPSGKEINFQNRHSHEDRGTLDVDMNGGGANSKTPVENVFFGDAEKGIEAPKGKYRVFVQNYAYHEKNKDVPVPFRVIVRKNGESTEYHGETAAKVTGQRSNVDVVTFTYDGRKAISALEGAPSALDASNLVAVTASVGSTLDALRSLMSVGAEVAEIERTRELLNEADDLEPLPASNEPMDVSDDMPEMEMDEEGNVIGMAVTVASHGVDRPEGTQAPTAGRRRFEVTSRDRLLVQLSKLPPRFHQEVANAFGGGSLLETAAQEIAARLLESGTPIGELRAAGYPAQVVDIVKRLMATRGAGTSAGGSSTS